MIFTCGDTHADIDYHKLNSFNFPRGRTLAKDDYLVIAGDFGAVWNSDKTDEYLQQWYAMKPWTTLIVDGNHENFDLLETYPEIEMFGDKVGQINSSIYHLKRGRVYEIDGNKIFTFGGGYSIDKDWRVEGESWWPQEMPTTDEYNLGIVNLEKHNRKVDYIITHSCPMSIFQVINERFDMGHKINGEDKLRYYFEEIMQYIDFKKWYFGHFHVDHDMDEFIAMYNNPPIKLN